MLLLPLQTLALHFNRTVTLALRSEGKVFAPTGASTTALLRRKMRSRMAPNVRSRLRSTHGCKCMATWGGLSAPKLQGGQS